MTDKETIEEQRKKALDALPDKFWEEYTALSKKLLEAEERNQPQEMKRIVAEMQQLLPKYE